MASNLSAGRIPPHNDDAERAVLGAVMLSSTAFSEVTEVLRKEDFYKPGHQALFDAILSFHQEHSSQTIDLITITEYLRSKNQLDLCGGMAYVVSLTSDVPTTANAIYYANIVRSHSLRRVLLELSGKIREDVFDESQDIASVLDESERKMSELQSSSGTFTDKYQESSILVNKTVDRLMERAKHGNKDGVKSGFQQLDEMTGGFQPSEFIVIGARPSVGKTAFAISMAMDMANAVLPTDGRAPITMNSEGWNPPVISSSCWNPDFTPSLLPCLARSINRSTVLLTRIELSWYLSVNVPLEDWSSLIFLSLSSKTLAISWDSSNTSSRIFPLSSSRTLRRLCERTILA